MKFLALVFLALSLFSAANVLASQGQTCASPGINMLDIGAACTGSYYNWGKAQNGWGYCYQYACTGAVLNGAQPVSDYFCESVRPSYFDWGKAQNGWGYCYQYTPTGLTMNVGKPVSNYSCEAVRPSYYSWNRSVDGQTRCYQYTAKGVAMNEGKPVSNYYCH